MPHPLDLVRDFDDAHHNRAATTPAQWEALVARLASGCRDLDATMAPATGDAALDARLAADVLWDAYTDATAPR